MRALRLSVLAIAVLIIGPIISACEQGSLAQPTPPTAPAPAANVTAVTQPTVEAPSPAPTSSAGKGTVRGVLVQIDTNKPLSTDVHGVDLFLAGIINGDFRTAALDKLNSPHAATDKDGHFVFSNVPPGEYALVMASPISQFLLHEPNNQSKDLIVTVEADKPLDLGTLSAKYP
jgi:hypothetical protein